MIDYQSLRSDEPRFVALTGLTPAEFQELLPPFARAYARRYPADRTQDGRPRQRQRGGGRSSILQPIAHKLLFVLVYQKTYPLQELLGCVFDLSQSRVNRWIHRLLPILRQALQDRGLLPERDPRQFARHERHHAEPLARIIDGTERRRQRPKNPEKQALHYSGKKKAHTDTHVVIVNAQSKRVGYLSGTYPGTTHDKKVAQGEGIGYPRRAPLYKDTGFQGYEPRVAQSRQPKKSRGGEN